MTSNNIAGARNIFLSLLMISCTWTLPEAIPYRYRWSHISLLFSCLSRDMVRVVTNNLVYLISYCSFPAISWCGSTRTSTSRKILWSRHLRNSRKVSHYCKNKPFLVFFPLGEFHIFFSVQTVDSCQLCVVFDWTWRSERLLLEKLEGTLYNDYRHQGLKKNIIEKGEKVESNGAWNILVFAWHVFGGKFCYLNQVLQIPKSSFSTHNSCSFNLTRISWAVWATGINDSNPVLFLLVVVIVVVFFAKLMEWILPMNFFYRWYNVCFQSKVTMKWYIASRENLGQNWPLPAPSPEASSTVTCHLIRLDEILQVLRGYRPSLLLSNQYLVKRKEKAAKGFKTLSLETNGVIRFDGFLIIHPLTTRATFEIKWII